MEELLFILRTLILDLDEPPKYSDVLLSRVLLASSLYVSEAMGWDYTRDSTNLLIVPDTDDDPTAQNLFTLKAACILQTDEAIKATERGILIKDDVGAVDTRDYASNIIDFLKSGKTYCDLYEEAEQDELRNNSNASVVAIMGPIREYYDMYRARR